MASIRCRSASPPGRVNSSSSIRPYFSVMTCQPAAVNMPRSRSAAMSGTTRSSDCRFTSTTQTTSPSSATPGSTMASHTAPSSSSASPSSEYWRPAGHRVAGEPVAQVAAGHGAPDRRGRADADRAGRVVHRVGVLDPAGIALQATERPQRRQVRLVQLAEQVVDRVQHGRGVRLDRHPVLCPQVPEPQRGHDRDHRRGRGLVPADLHPAGIGPDPVCVVDDRRRQPQDLAFDLAQRVDGLGLRRGLDDVGHGCMTARPRPGHNSQL